MNNCKCMNGDLLKKGSVRGAVRLQRRFMPIGIINRWYVLLRICCRSPLLLDEVQGIASVDLSSKALGHLTRIACM